MPAESKWRSFMLNKNRGWFTNFLLNCFDKMLPETTWLKDFKDLPSFPMYIAAFIFNGAWYGIFFYFIVTAYKSGVTDTYISFDKESGDCTEVPFDITGTYNADQSGRWESNSKYDDASHLYTARFIGYSSTNDQYKTLLGTNMTKAFNTTGEIGKYRDLAWNLIAHAAYSYTSRKYGRLDAYASGEIATMLDKEYSNAGVGSSAAGIADSNCISSVSYDAIAGVMTAAYAYDAATTECKEVADTFGFDGEYGDEFTFDLDLVAFSTATAVNYGIISTKQLVEITDSPKKGYGYDEFDGTGGDDFSYSGNTDDGDDYTTDDGGAGGSYGSSYGSYGETNVSAKVQNVGTLSTRDLSTEKISILEKNKAVMRNSLEQARQKEHRRLASSSTKWRLFYDEKYEGMPPIACVIFNGTKANSTCFLQYFDKKSSTKFTPVYAYPIAKHYSGTDCYNTTVWGPAWYNSDPTKNGNWVKQYDHTIDVLMGLIVFKRAADAADFARESFEYRYKDSKKGDLVIPDRVYSSLLAVVDGSDGYSAEDVCGVNSTSGNVRDCFLWSFNQYGSNYYISPSNYQLFAGACRNSLYNNYSINGLSLKSPEDLVQTFYECVLKPYDSFFNALGLSTGNADVYTAFFFFFFMFVYVFSLKSTRDDFDPALGEFTSKEQEEEGEEAAPEVEMKSNVNPMKLNA